MTRLAGLSGVSAIASVADIVIGNGDADAGATPLLIVGGRRVDAYRTAQPHGWEAAIAVPGATARSFTDDGVVLAQIAQRYPRTEPVVRRDIGEAQPLAYRTVRQSLVRFFDAHLRGAPIGTFAMEPGVTVDLVVP